MQLEEKKKLIENTTKELLEKMGFKATVYISTTVAPESKEEEPPISVEIELTDSKYLIGKYGVNLSAVQHLLRILVRKKTENEKINFSVDVNGYRQEQRNSIILMAKESAHKAFKEKKVVVMRPMNAFERRLVHVELAEFEGIKTESIGEGENRKVVIKPISISEELDL